LIFIMLRTTLQAERRNIKRARVLRSETLFEASGQRSLLQEIDYDDDMNWFAKKCKILDSVILELTKFDKGVNLGSETYVRFKYQAQIHNLVLASMIPTIFGTSSSLYAPELRARYGFEDLDTMAHAIMMSRRMGKTSTMVMIVAALMIHVPNFVCSVIANSYRAAQMFTDQVASVLRALGHDKLEPRNQKSVGLLFPGGDQRICWALPGKSTDNLRGLGPNLLILEEAAFVPEPTVKAVVIPVMIVNKTCIVAISTLSADANNFFNRSIKRDLLKVFSVELICDKCKKLKNKKLEVCEHRIDLRPPWHTLKIDARIRELMNDDETYERETLGIIPGDAGDTHQFPDTLVDAFMNAPRLPMMVPTRQIFLIVDPEGGTAGLLPGRDSPFVAVSMAYPEYTLLGMESMSAAHHGDFIDMLAEHITKIRQIQACNNALIILDVASGDKLQAKIIIDKLVERNVPRIYASWEASRQKLPMIKLKSKEREEMATCTRYVLAEPGGVRISPGFVSISHPEGPTGMLADLDTQLKAYERRTKPGRTKVEYSGRGDHDNKPDEAAVAFQRMIRLLEGFKHLGVVMR
jgi:hypothetical protein